MTKKLPSYAYIFYKYRNISNIQIEICKITAQSLKQQKENQSLSNQLPGESNGTPLQYSCMESPMDGGAWWAAVHGVAKSRTRLSDFTFTFHFHFSLSCIGEGNGNSLQCSCLENPRDGGACWAAMSGVTQSRTRLKRLSSSSIHQLSGIAADTVDINIYFIFSHLVLHSSGSCTFFRQKGGASRTPCWQPVPDGCRGC